jgi:hypothetical protein
VKIFLKIDSIKVSLGDSFTLSSNTGSVSPNTASRGDLLGGVELEVDASASSITVTKLGGGAQFTQSIDKSIENCIDLNIDAQANLFN